jgi:hypothetical protein
MKYDPHHEIEDQEDRVHSYRVLMIINDDTGGVPTGAGAGAGAETYPSMGQPRTVWTADVHLGNRASFHDFAVLLLSDVLKFSRRDYVIRFFAKDELMRNNRNVRNEYERVGLWRKAFQAHVFHRGAEPAVLKAVPNTVLKYVGRVLVRDALTGIIKQEFSAPIVEHSWTSVSDFFQNTLDTISRLALREPSVDWLKFVFADGTEISDCSDPHLLVDEIKESEHGGRVTVYCDMPQCTFNVIVELQFKDWTPDYNRVVVTERYTFDVIVGMWTTCREFHRLVRDKLQTLGALHDADEVVLSLHAMRFDISETSDSIVPVNVDVVSGFVMPRCRFTVDDSIIRFDHLPVGTSFSDLASEAKIRDIVSCVEDRVDREHPLEILFQGLPIAAYPGGLTMSRAFFSGDLTVRRMAVTTMDPAPRRLQRKPWCKVFIS